MVTDDSDSSGRIGKSHVDDDDDDDRLEGLENKLNQLKREIQGERVRSIKEKFEANRKKVDVNVSPLSSAALNRATAGDSGNSNTFSSRMETPLCKLNGFSHGVGDRDYVPTKDVISASVKLPIAERIPPYTTWIFLDRNQRMAEDQSVVGRRQIYYEQHGGETLICSDSEEEPEPEEEKREYSEGEDSVIWLIGQEYGMGEEVQDALSQFLSVDASDILERYEELKLKNEQNVEDFSNSGFKLGISLEKGLGAALDSFDNLFCRRCLVFDCRLHGCSQPLITASEKQPYWSDFEGDRNPCSKHCYLQAVREVPGASSNFASKTEEKASEEEYSKAVSPEYPHDAGGGVNLQVEKTDTGSKNLDSSSGVEQEHGIRGKREVPNPEDSNVSNKKQKNEASDTKMSFVNSIPSLDQTLDSTTKSDLGGAADTNKVNRGSGADAKEVAEPIPDNLVHDGGSSVYQPEHGSGNGAIIIGDMSETSQPSTEWKAIEKDLYLKGVEIFGRNSCLIARNMLSGLKTCLDVSSYMRENEVSVFRRSSTPSLLLDDGRTDPGMDDEEVPPRTRLFRRKGKTRKLKYSTKSAGHPSVWKRIAGGKNQSCKQYTPCGCLSMCGKDCPCLTNETCCEKYCGCSKSCKNRFRGCHCAKSQCRSRQCPCFAAGRECDPDVCRNCWVSCGDGSLGEAPRRGEGQCGNMRLLLRQQQRILLGKSDVAGWGAFLKNSVSKNEYLGEYTGELISHREADKRGKIYDRANSSFLFDLNDQDEEVPPRTRLFRRKGKTRKLKYSTKSAGHPSVWKRIAGGKNQSCKQYTPCGCLSMCGKDCPCLTNETCCEKYCGCSKSCKNRFRGCHCAKSQCRSRQCPCFAAGRECDPDVCRNCWVSCGDGSLGEAPRRGEGQCGNMRLLLRQQQRILLGKSDVAGWGAFLKNSVSKNEYLGEYTGELISHREADKRGKIYDRANSSFLFDLNDQYVLDAQRKGDKLKFANHSAKPNCYAKVMFVAGDHRVGIFANERIEASEELFYDYRYGPDQAPAWARKPEGSKKDDSAITHRRARKHQSH